MPIYFFQLKSSVEKNKDWRLKILSLPHRKMGALKLHTEQNYTSMKVVYGGLYESEKSVQRFWSADPKADNFPHVSVYNYAENKVPNAIDLWGLQALVITNIEKNPDHKIDEYKAAKTTREFGFAVRHPEAATRIGMYQKGSTNVSTNAVRFANRGNILGETKTGMGSEVNAFRHTLWQAAITTLFGSEIATEAGNAHENDPSADTNDKVSSTIEGADEKADLLNNEIGRNIGINSSNLPMNDLASKVLNEFATNGLYTVSTNANNEFVVSKSIITNAQFKKLSNIFNGVNANGRTPKEQADVNNSTKHKSENPKSKL